ncbi:ataxin-1-like [Monodelphis domestica]|uniref:ataxin-1-like n=1 Tax=Monodelphis domestica TaxID=13616 RepID=UPI0024E21D9C|nr:ataxin-1-like [Monodelphis domestica]XP_056680312.1 ataxin-1-like [Monodelphis domestica]XP_056680314.1 ataxin-1-like [Monodelphis domestica]XP_056680320.1 ataxin-1-like [Monodelphis domestica]
MKPVHERSQECLPPKKRDLPVTSEDMGRTTSCSTNHTPSSDSSDWCRGVVVTGQTQAGVRQSVGSDGVEAITGLTVDQYGMLYKVAMPPATFSSTGLHPVVNMSPLPSAFNVASSLIQHPGIHYPPIHYAQLPPTSLQFIGSPYTMPYAMPPNFLPSPLLSPSANLTTSHVPHFVPYASLLAEGATPPPPTTSPVHSFNKVPPATSPPSQLQHHSGTQPVDLTPGRVPIYYQMSRLPTGYTTHEIPSTRASPDAAPVLHDVQPVPDVTASNGGQRQMERSLVRQESEAMDPSSNKDNSQGLGPVVECVMDGQLFSGSQTPRMEVALPAHRGTPDTDLEVQRVVGTLVTQDYRVVATQRKDEPSPLNLSHHVPDHQGEVRGLVRNPIEMTEKSQAHGLYTQSSQELAKHRPLPKAMVIANGNLVPIGTEQGLLSMGSEILVTSSVDMQVRATFPNKEPTPPPSTSSHLPSHFMKGAIIQLATGELKRVEDLQTQDFVRSAEVSGGLKIDSSTVVDIQESQWPGFVMLHFVVGEQQSKVSIDVPPEHPFFVYGQGWSSCSPGRTAQLFSLPCHRLQVGDVCISISLQSLNSNSVSQAGFPSPDQLGPSQERPERTVLGSREPSDSDRKSQPSGEGAPVQSSHTMEPSQPEPGAQSCWPAAGFQRYSVQGEEARATLLRPSFIPQEVKLSIEGRSNAGK